MKRKKFKTWQISILLPFIFIIFPMAGGQFLSEIDFRSNEILKTTGKVTGFSRVVSRRGQVPSISDFNVSFEYKLPSKKTLMSSSSHAFGNIRFKVNEKVEIEYRKAGKHYKARIKTLTNLFWPSLFILCILYGIFLIIKAIVTTPPEPDYVKQSKNMTS